MGLQSSAKVALITGGASGMGLATAKSLAANGWKVSLVDLNAETGLAAASKLNGIFTQTDVAVYDQLAAAFTRTWTQYGRLDFVFANAGIIERSSFYAKHPSDADGLPPPPNLLASRVMFDGALMTIYLGLHFLRKNAVPGGSIIILASSAGIYPAPNGPLYTASKHGMVGLTRAMAGRLGEESIHISCICPGSVETGLMTKEQFARMDQETFTPVEKIASVVCLLLERREETRGAAVEVIGEKHYLRWRPAFCDENMEKCWNGFGGSSEIRDGGLSQAYM